MKTKSARTLVRLFQMFLILVLMLTLSAFTTQEGSDWHINLTAENLIYWVSTAVSLLFSYFPPVSEWFYNKLTSNGQRIFMFLTLVVITGAIFALSCTDVLSGVSCTQAGAKHIIEVFVFALILNQTTDRISPKTAIRTEAKSNIPSKTNDPVG